MLRENALKMTRINAINQCKKMTDLVDNIAETAIKSMVAGEELRTKSPLGVQMLMTKYVFNVSISKEEHNLLIVYDILLYCH